MFLPFFIESSIDYHLRISYYWNFFNFSYMSLYLSLIFGYYFYLIIVAKCLYYFTKGFLSELLTLGEAGLWVITLEDDSLSDFYVPKNFVSLFPVAWLNFFENGLSSWSLYMSLALP